MNHRFPIQAIQAWLVVYTLLLLVPVNAHAQRRITTRGADQHYQTGMLLLEGQKLDQAIAELSLATKLNPGFAAAHNALGIALARKGEINEAGESFRRAIQINPRLYEAHLGLASVLQQRGDFNGAIEVLTHAVEVLPTSAQANYFLGEAYLNLKKGSKAVAYMNEAIRIDPLGKAEIHLRIAEIYDAVGLKDLAAIEYEQFLKKKPDYPDRGKLQKYIAGNKKK